MMLRLDAQRMHFKEMRTGKKKVFIGLTWTSVEIGVNVQIPLLQCIMWTVLEASSIEQREGIVHQTGQ